MKLIINFIIILILSMNISISAEKKDCSVYKKISKSYLACKASNIKTGAKNTAVKIKEKTGNVMKVTAGKIKKNK